MESETTHYRYGMVYMAVNFEEQHTGIGGELLDDFKLIKEIGRGGMGRVFEAEQLSLQRRVAVKILPLTNALSTSNLTRFKCEAMVAAQLKHPNIVNVYAVGCDQGLDYYAMEYIDGRNLAEIIAEVRESRSSTDERTVKEAELTSNCDTLEWTPAADPLANDNEVLPSTIEQLEFSEVLSSVRDSFSHSGGAARELRGKRLTGWYSDFVADLILQVTEALKHAHGMGVVHRDIKPSNLMLDSQGRVVVTDFGLCRVEAERDLTASGTVLGTLRYSSPEQASGKQSILDERTDVYSLGVTLYELLTLRPPFESRDASQLLLQVLHEDPPAPRKIAPWIPEDLETIVLKATAKDTKERYQSAKEFGNDLRRFLDDRPIHAKRPSLASRVTKWAKRNTALMIGVTLLLLFGSVSLLVSTVLIAQAKSKTTDALIVARRQTDLASKRAADLEAQVRTNQLLRYVADMKLAERALKDRDLRRLTQILGRFRTDSAEKELRGPEWGYLWNRANSTYVSLEAHVGGSYQVRYSHDGRLFATCGGDSKVRIYHDGAIQPHSVLNTEQGEVNGIAFDEHSMRIATAGDDGTIRIFDLETERETLRIDAYPEMAFGVLFADQGKLLVTCGRDPQIRLWDSATGESRGTLQGHSRAVEAIYPMPGGRYFASASADKTARIWDLDKLSEESVFTSHTDKLSSVGCTPDGQQLITGDIGGTAIVWQVTTGKELYRAKYADGVQAIACSPDGKTIAVSDRGGVIHLLPRTSTAEQEPQEWKAHDGKVYGLAFNPQNSALISTGQNGPVRVWHLSECASQFTVASPYIANDIAFVTNSNRLTIATKKGIYLADLQHDGHLRTIESAGDWACVTTSRESGLIAAGSANGTLAAWDESTGRQLGRWNVVKGKIYDIVVIDESHVAWLSWEHDAGVTIVNVQTGKKVRFIPAEQCESMCISPDGKWLAVVMHGDFITLWNLPSSGPPLELRGHRSTVTNLAFDPTSTTLYSVSNDRTLNSWSVSTGRLVASRVAHESDIDCVAVSGGGHTVATAAEHASLIRLWNAASGQLLFDIRTPTPMRQVAFNSDSSYLAGLREDGMIEVFHTSLEVERKMAGQK